MDDRSGTRLGRYRLLSLLGRGGMGTVYLAEHEALGSLWVVKLLRPEYAGDPHHVERFLREARAVATLRHPNVVQVVDVDCTDNTPYFVMEHLEGEDLQAMIRRAGPIPWRQARDLVLQVCSAMHAAHRRGIVHRDLKPANLYCVAQPLGPPLVKVLDFGIAKMLAPADGDDALTNPGVAMGTPLYMAPECLQGADATPLSDIYSLGVVLYQLLTSQLPFHGTGPALLVDVLGGPPPDICRVAPAAELPPQLAEILRGALAREPARRISSMQQFADLLLGVTEARAHVTRVVSPRTVRRSARSGLWLSSVMLVVLPMGYAMSQTFDASAPIDPPVEAAAERPTRPALEPPPVPIAPVVAEPPLPDCRETVEAALAAFSTNELASCGRRHHARRGEPMDVLLTIDDAGRVRRVRMRPSFFEDDPFGQCVRRALLTRTFAACVGDAPRTHSHKLVYGRRSAP
jgi:serine/threonine protein kinase